MMTDNFDFKHDSDVNFRLHFHFVQFYFYFTRKQRKYLDTNVEAIYKHGNEKNKKSSESLQERIKMSIVFHIT